MTNGGDTFTQSAPDEAPLEGVTALRESSDGRYEVEPSAVVAKAKGKRSPRRKIGTNAPAGKVAAVFVAPSTLLVWSGNTKKKNARWKKAVDMVAASIREFGFGAPIVARAANREIIKGHVRHEAALLLGLDEVPVRFMELSARKAHLLAAADNELARISETDEEALEELLSDYDEAERHLAGFDAEDNTKISKASDVEEVDVGAITAEFWMAVRGPMPKQPDVIEQLKAAIAKLPGVTVEHGIIG